MTPTPLRGWRFLHPDLDAPGEVAGLQVSARGRIDMVQGPGLLRQAILMVLSTVPGERVQRPDYGCDLHRLIFSPNDDATAGLAIHYVRQALERWEPRAEVLRLDASRSPEREELLEIVLEYRERASNTAVQLVTSIDLTGGVA